MESKHHLIDVKRYSMKITKMQNILLNFMVILLYFCYCNIIYFYLGYGHMVYMGTAYNYQVGSAWGNVGQCQLVLMKVTSHYLFLHIKLQILGNISLAYM